MDKPHRHRALAHRGGDPLDRAAAHVARCEYTRHARLQVVRCPRTFLPDVSPEHGALERSPRQDEAAFVELDGPPQPAGIGLSSDEYEKGPRFESPARVQAV